jgi:hypothetical protein
MADVVISPFLGCYLPRQKSPVTNIVTFMGSECVLFQRLLESFSMDDDAIEQFDKIG